MNSKTVKRLNCLCMLMLVLVLGYLLIIHLDPDRGTKLYNSYFSHIPFFFLGIALCMASGRCTVDIWLLVTALCIAFFITKRAGGVITLPAEKQ